MKFRMVSGDFVQIAWEIQEQFWSEKLEWKEHLKDEGINGGLK
jgi:hypothetical protein